MLKNFLAQLLTHKCILILALLSIVSSVAASYSAGFNLMMNVRLWPYLFWLLSIGLMLAAGWRSLKLDKKHLRSSLLWFALFTALALPWRVVDTTHIPVCLSGDEGSAGLWALNYLNGNANNPFTIGWYSFPSMSNFLQAGSIALIGQTIPGLRLLSGVIGALTAGAVYWLGRDLFGHKVGVLAAICMVGFHYHIHFSRISLNNVWDSLFFCLSLAAFWSGWKRENRFLFILSGLSAGLALYFYETSKLLLLLLGLWIVCLAFSNPHKFKRCLPFLAFFALAVFIVAFPLLRYYIEHSRQMLSHTDRFLFRNDWLALEAAKQGETQLAIFLRQWGKGLGAFITVPLTFFYMPGTALLRPAEALLFTGGLVLCIRFVRDPRAQMMLLWVLLFSCLGGFTESTPASQRYIGAAPVCMLGVALALRFIETWLRKQRFTQKTPLWLFTVVVAVFLARADIIFYFQEYTPASDYGGIGARIETALAENLNAIPGEKNVYYWGYPQIAYGSISVLPFLAPTAHGYDMDEFSETGTIPEPAGEAKFFIFLAEDADLARITDAFPGGTLTREEDRTGRFLFWQYAVIEPWLENR